MPDPMLILKAMGAAAGVAAVLLLLCGWPWRAPNAARASAGWVLGVGAGFYLGCWMLGLWPHWPPREDQDRLLLLVLPAVIGVELVVAVSFMPWWLAWPLRLTVAAGAARVLLHHTTYLTELGPNTPEWTPAQASLVLGGWAAALAVLWVALARLAYRAPGRSLPLALSLTCAGAAVAIMLSGYSTGGQLGLPLAAALGGATLASLALSGPPRAMGAVGIGVVGLFCLLVIGYFFSELTRTHAALLLAAPLLCWLPELAYVRRLRFWLRGLIRVALVAVLVVVVLSQAQRKFVEDSRPASPSATEPSIQDYMDFGK